MTFIEKASELDVCYITTGLCHSIMFNICNVEVTESELVLSDLDFGEVRIPLDELPVPNKELDSIMEVWESKSIRFEF